MKWTRFRIQTTVDAEDILVSELYDIGFEGAQIEDKVPLTALEKERMFVDIAPETEEDDGVAFVSFFAETGEDGLLLFPLSGAEREVNASGASLAAQGSLAGDEAAVRLAREEVLARVEGVLEELRGWGLDLGEASVDVSETEDLDWINNWKQYFRQFSIDDILVLPSWEEIAPGNEGKMVLHIDPGTAFGTGMHETTQLCIRRLRRAIRREDAPLVLDIGTGSGILGILSLMFGAGGIAGTDLDPCAESAVAENLAKNGIAPERFALYIGNLITDEALRERVGFGKYDIVVANILAEVLIPLAPVAARHLKPGGLWIASGILAQREEAVKEAMTAAGLEIEDTAAQGEWVCVAARRPETGAP